MLVIDHSEAFVVLSPRSLPTWFRISQFNQMHVFYIFRFQSIAQGRLGKAFLSGSSNCSHIGQHLNLKGF